MFEHKDDSQRRANVTLFVDASFNKHLGSTQADIRVKALVTRYHERRLRAVESEDGPAASRELRKARVELDEARVWDCRILSLALVRTLAYPPG